MRAGLQDVVRRTVAKCEQYTDLLLMITDGMCLLLNAAQTESLHKPEADDDDDENQSIF